MQLPYSTSLTAYFNTSTHLLPTMPFINDTYLPLSSELKLINHFPAHNPRRVLSTMSANTSYGGTRQHPIPTPTSVAQALEIARDSPEGAQDGTVVRMLEGALKNIWGEIQAKPTSYVMTKEEFAIFNYFQQRFEGNQLAVAARKRYWDRFSA